MTSQQLLEESLQIRHFTRDPKALEAGVARSHEFSIPKSDNQDTSPVSPLANLLGSGDQFSSRSLWQQGEPGSPDQQGDDMQQVEGRNQQALEDCFRRHREYGKYLKHRGLLQKEHEGLAAMTFPPQHHQSWVWTIAVQLETCFTVNQPTNLYRHTNDQQLVYRMRSPVNRQV